MSAPVMVLPVNTKRETGRAAQLGNITAAKAVADIIRTTLGPRWVNDALATSLFLLFSVFSRLLISLQQHPNLPRSLFLSVMILLPDFNIYTGFSIKHTKFQKD